MRGIAYRKKNAKISNNNKNIDLFLLFIFI